MNIKRIISRLEDIIAYSEKEFLAIGRTLSDIDRQSSAIAMEASHLNDLTAGSTFEEQHPHFELFLQEYRLSSPMPKVFSDGFTRISLLLENQHNLLLKLINQMKTIKKTDLVVRVELSHQNDQNGVYTDLIEQVTRVADEIMAKARIIQLKTLALQENLEKSGLKARDLFDSIEDRTRQILEASHSRLHFMFDHHQQSRALAAELSGGSAELLQRLDLMIGRLQTHDIVRQQLQHVILFLGHYKELPDPLKPLDEALNILGQANNHFFEAVDHIRMQLVTINTHLTLLLEQCIQLTSRYRTDFMNPESQPFLHMEELVFATDLCIKLDRIFAPLAAEIDDTLKLNQSELQRINHLSSDIALLAQNAALAAEHAEQGHSTYNILAEQTQRDIASVRISLNHLLDEQQKIEQETSDFISVYEKTNQSIEIFFEKTSAIDELLQPLEQTQLTNSQRIRQLIPQMEQVITSINSLIDTFHTDPHHSSAITEAIQVLSTTRHEFVPNGSAQAIKDVSDWADYPTHRSNIEKKVHQAIINPTGPSGRDRDSSNPDQSEDVEFF